MSRHLADLFARAEVSTALQPQHNSVIVKLGSEVAPSRRAELEQAAARAGVDVSIATVPYRHLRIRRESRCNEFAAGKAYCEKPIVAGVTIEAKKGCSAGPAVRLKDRTTPLNSTATFILTAGHWSE